MQTTAQSKIPQVVKDTITASKAHSGELKKDERSEITQKHERMENTPFHKIWVKDAGWAITLGNKRLTEFYEGEAEAEKFVTDKEWTLLFALIDDIVDYKLEMAEINRRSQK